MSLPPRRPTALAARWLLPALDRGAAPLLPPRHWAARGRADQQQVRCASLIRRPRRPFHFTQLVRLTDGSTFTVRTTSPQPVFAPDRDTFNNLVWQPSSKALRRIEVDEAGKLASFRGRFGRSFDLRSRDDDGGPALAPPPPPQPQQPQQPQDPPPEPAPPTEDDMLLDLITQYAVTPTVKSTRRVAPKVEEETYKKKQFFGGGRKRK